MPDEVQTLRAALDAANRRNADLTKTANEALGTAHSATQNQAAANVVSTTNAIEQTRSAQSIAQQRYQSLSEAGDFAGAGEAMKQMSEASARIAQLEGQKVYWEQQADRLKSSQPAQVADPLSGYSAQERSWIDRHPEYLTNPAYKHKVDAAASEAMNIHGHARNSEEYFKHITAAVQDQQQQQTRTATGGDVDAGGGDVDDGGSFSDTGEDNRAPVQRHTIDLPSIETQVETPVMRLDKPEEPQQRAVGRGGGGISATAAPPSRRIAEAGRKAGTGQVSLTQDELTAAMAMADSIEGDKTNGWDATKYAEWYYMMAHHPSHQNTRRRSWARDSVIA